MGDVSYPLGRTRALALTNHKKSPLSIPHYPLPNNELEFLKISGDEVQLLVPFKWEGFCTSKGSPQSISPLEATSARTVTMITGDYASILHDDLRIMIKIGPAPAPSPVDKTIRKRFHQSFFRFIAPTADDGRGLLIGFFAASIIVGGFILGLMRRPFARPASLRDIPEEYMLAFLSPDHLRSAPEILKFKLNRLQFTTSVLEYYQDLAGLLTHASGTPRGDTFPFTSDLYRKMHADARVKISTIISRQVTVDDEQKNRSNTAQIMIPAVVGESMTSRVLRILDKISIIQDGMSEALQKRRDISEAFPKDPEYGYEEYRNLSKLNKNAEFLAQIRPWQQLSDEQLMYEAAETLAGTAAGKQKGLLTNLDKSDALTPESGTVVGLTEGTRFLTFLANPPSTALDRKLDLIQGSQFGVVASQQRVQEPLVGVIEPHLVERFIRQNRYQLQLCYEVALRRNEATSGTMEWKWRIDSRGVISDIALVKSSIQDRNFTTCLQDKISRWRFPRPRRGAVEVSYPFEFAPNKGRG